MWRTTEFMPGIDRLMYTLVVMNPRRDVFMGKLGLISIYMGLWHAIVHG